MRNRALFARIGLATLAGLFFACASIDRRLPAADLVDYPRIFEFSRNFLIRPPARTLGESLLLESVHAPEASFKIKDIAETQIVDVFARNPTLLPADGQPARVLGVGDLAAFDHFDPRNHVRLLPPAGHPGYEDLQLFVNHPHYVSDTRVPAAENSHLMPADDLRTVWLDFLKSAQRKIIVNVFDFDLQAVADVLVEKSRAGLEVKVGIDNGVIRARKPVKKIYDFLVANGVDVTAVSGVGLNHQKIVAIDWDSVDEARVLVSSGNLTQSCLGPGGDLEPLGLHHRFSVPNANHVLTMKSWLLANLVRHELLKTLAPLQLRGAEYPLSGSYQITGPGVDPLTPEFNPSPSFSLAFSPGGGGGQINKTMIADVIERTHGPLAMVQFAFSSSAVGGALLQRALREIQAGRHFEFTGIGDTPFSMQYWSQFLKMSGLKLQMLEDQPRAYVEDEASDWRAALGPDELLRLRKRIRIAPDLYGTHSVKIQNKKYGVTSKLHHKVLVSEDYAILGTSFNFSEGAETNNEQMLVFRDAALADQARGLIQWISNNSKHTIYDEALRRNKFKKYTDESADELPSEVSDP